MSKQSHDRIRALNDAFRASLVTATPLGKLYATIGVASRGARFQVRVIEAVVAFDAFNTDIDPHREHDMIRVTVDDVIVWAKIDYYATSDPDLGSEDPADPTKTERVMTLMKPEEY
jgi:Protein of unknown function (DUF3768)